MEQKQRSFGSIKNRINMKTIVISGGSSGIGRATVKQFLNADEDCRVITFARRMEKLQGLTAELSDQQRERFKALRIDLEHPEFSELVESVEQFGGKVDVLINNAGLLIVKPFDQLTRQDIQRSYQVNIMSVYELIQTLLPYMPSGNILNISTMGGVRGSQKFSGLSAYSSSKSALLNLTELLAEEFSDRGIHVNAIALGAVDTPMLASAFPDFKTDVTPERVSEYIYQLTTSDYKLLNGKTIELTATTP